MASDELSGAHSNIAPLWSVDHVVVHVGIDDFKLEGGELFKEGFRKLLNQE